MSRWSRDQKKVSNLKAQLAGSPAVVEFLTWLLTDIYVNNVFTEGYGAQRAEHDGRAKCAEDILTLLMELTNDTD